MSAERVQPNGGGCWFCLSNTGNMLFSIEFDTFVHRICLERAWRNGNEEADIMVREFAKEANHD